VCLDAAGPIDLGRIDLNPARRAAAAHKGGAAHIGDLCHRLAPRQPVRDLDQRALGVAVEQHIALGIDHDRAPHLVAPVIVVGDAAQAGLDAAQHDGHLFVGLAAALAIDDGGAVWALAAHVAGGVGVVGADFAIGRVAVDHRIHVTRRHAPKQIGLPQRLEGLGAVPIGLGDDAHPKALGLEHAPDHGHAKAGVIDIGVARDQHHVAAVPAQALHLGAAGGQKRRNAKALGPVGLVTAQGLECLG